jgi:hypothetical protein
VSETRAYSYEFCDLQDRLQIDQPSKAIEWLIWYE